MWQCTIERCVTIEEGGNSQWIVHATRIYQATTLKNPSSKHARPNCVLRQRAIDEHVTQTQQTKTWKKSRPLHSSNCATYSGRPNNSHAMFNQRIPSNIVSNRRPWRIWRHGRGRHGFGTDRQRQQTSTRTSKLRSNVQRTAAKDASYNSTTSIHATSCCTTILGMASATQTLGINDPTRRWAKPLQEMKRRPTTHASNHAHSTHRRNWSWQNRPWWAEGDTPCQEPVDNVGYCELKCATHGAQRNQCREQEPTKLTGRRSTLPCPHISGGPQQATPRASQLGHNSKHIKVDYH